MADQRRRPWPLAPSIGGDRARRAIASASLVAYVGLILALTLLMFPNDHPTANLVPFRSMANDWKIGGREFLINFLGNIAAFVPIGRLIPAARRRPTRARDVAIACLALSGSIEILQYLFARRVADVDDVILNVLGGLVGFALARRRPSPINPVAG